MAKSAHLVEVAEWRYLLCKVVVFTCLECDIVGVEDARVWRQKVAVMEFYEEISQGSGRFWNRFQGNL